MRSQYIYIVILVFAVWLIPCGCGIKGPPVPPGYVKPPAVTDLQYQQTGENLILTWTIPKATQDATHVVAGAKVMVLKKPLKDVYCEDCPQVYTPIKTVPAKSGTMRFQTTIEDGFDYYFKVVLYDDRNQNGPSSNIIHIGPGSQ